MKQLQAAFGQHVKRLRKERGYSQNEFAVAAGLTQAYLSRIERGIANPQLDIVQKIAVCLGISIPDLFNFDMASVAVKELHQEEKTQRLIAVFQDLPRDVTAKLYDALAAQLKRK